MRQSPWPMRLTNSFGTLGYLSCSMQWAWTIIVMCYPIITDQNSFLLKRDLPQVATTVANPAPPNPVVAVVLIVVTAALLVFTIITLVRMPKTVGKTGAKLTRTTSAALLPVLTHHKKISKQRRIILSYRTTLFIKFFATVAPLVVLLLAPTIPAMPQNVIWAVAIFCFAWTALVFGAQVLMVRLLKLSKSDAW